MDHNTAATMDQLLALFNHLNIEVNTHNHAPVATTADADPLYATIPGAHCKNLFLKNKEGSYFLITMLGHQHLDLKNTAELLSVPRFSFASDAQLIEKLGVTPGSVTPFAVINDADKDVHLILDKEMMDHNLLNFHPLRNDYTCSIQREDLLKFFGHTGHAPRTILLPKKAT